MSAAVLGRSPYEAAIPGASRGAVRRRPAPAATRSSVRSSVQSSGRSSVRLTRRGRLLIFVSVLLMLLATAVAVGSSVVATSGAGEPIQVRTVTVQPGQTLWDIALASGVGGDPRDAVHEIEQLNHLDGAAVQIGQTLDVPVAG